MLPKTSGESVIRSVTKKGKEGEREQERQGRARDAVKRFIL